MLGEPYGTLILTFSVVAIEVMLISTVMLADGRPGHDVRGDDDRAQRRDRALAGRRRSETPHAELQPAWRERVPVRDHPPGHDRADHAERHALDRRGDAEP